MTVHTPHLDSLPFGALTTRQGPRTPDAGTAVETDDGLRTVRGIAAGALLSLPVWVGVAVVAWKAAH